MTEIRLLTPADFDAFIPIVASAYPAFRLNTAEDRQRFNERLLAQDQDPTTSYHGLFRHGRLLGGMKLYDFTLTLYAARALMGGVGLLAVDLLHKKERVAKDLMRYFLDYYRQRGAPLVALYPFRPDFYKQMGFGYGPKMNQYHVRPASLPRGRSRDHLRFLTPADRPALVACYDRVAGRTHGMTGRSPLVYNAMLDNPAQRLLGYWQGDELHAYLAFELKDENPVNFLEQHMLVHEFVYEHTDALREMLTFLHVQFDQVEHIVFNTQDESFHFLLADPRKGSGRILPHVSHESNSQGVGLMYRLVNPAAFFTTLRAHTFGGQDCRLKITLRDSFFPPNDASLVVHFVAGLPTVLPADAPAEVAIAADVADLSSLLMGVVDFATLHRYGLADLSDPAYLETIDRLFRTPHRPICLTRF